MRKTKTVIIEFACRDKGKKFKLTEMSAFKAEKWASRIFEALSKIKIEIPDEVKGASMAALATVGLRVLNSINFIDSEPLLDEMLSCVQFIPENEGPRDLLEDDINDMITLTYLRSELFNLHTGFFISRRRIELPSVGGRGSGDLAEYFNIPQTIGAVITSGKATLYELDSIYGVEDLYDLLEVLIVNAHNEQIASNRNQ